MNPLYLLLGLMLGLGLCILYCALVEASKGKEQKHE